MLLQRWRDELLYWDPSDYENIEEIMLPYDVIWLPVSFICKDDKPVKN